MCDVGDALGISALADPLGAGSLNNVLNFAGGGGSRRRRPTWTQRQRQRQARQQRRLEDEINTILSVAQSTLGRRQGLERDTVLGEADIVDALYRDHFGPLARSESELASRAQREADLADFERLGPRFTEARLAADPIARQRQGLESQLLTEAGQQVALGSQLSPVELRRAQQAARSNRTSRGFGQGSESDLFHEALDVATQGEGLRQSRLQQALGIAGGVRGGEPDIFMAVTGRPAFALPYAQQAAGLGLGRAPNTNPFDNQYAQDWFNTRFNADYANLFSRRNTNAARDAAEKQLIGSIISGVLGAAGGAAAAI